jgi:6-pyruvoyl tetrahydropterin synthase
MTRSSDQAQSAFSTTKLFDDLPCVHRTWQHRGKCALLHGYERRFEIEFGCTTLAPDTGFVIDLGDLKETRALLERQFDHTTLIAADDPGLAPFRGTQPRRHPRPPGNEKHRHGRRSLMSLRRRQPDHAGAHGEPRMGGPGHLTRDSKERSHPAGPQ